ncbi:MAG: type II secretion system protein GspE [Lachnospira sp.]|nr:type II secretion system protein GspE [Lachnospira sp.]
MAGFRKKMKIGEVLIEKNLITQEQLEIALEEKKKRGLLLGDTIVELGYIPQETMIDVLTRHLNIEYIDVREIAIDENAFKLLPENFLRKYNVLPYGYAENNANALLVAMSDPMNIEAMDDINIYTGMQVVPILAMRDHINAIIDKFYGKQQGQDIAEQFKQENAENAEEEAQRKEDIENAPIVKLVNGIIEQAVRQRASDIHIEPFEYNVRIRYRVDGSLREVSVYDKAVYSAMNARLKIMSGMDISEKRKPQDGRITINIDRKEYDIRVSNLPTVYGEKVVMRIASKEGFNKNKKDLGLRESDLVKFDNILRNPHGIILVTGPTGSGKSTTLYTALSELNTEDVNIITVEDPVEANIDGINQVQVNNKADMTFANALRSILRQDPDIIMIGEIRDSETAEIAVKASITGHLVVSTLHTNSTASSITRLADMGIEPYLIADSVVGVIAQRLVRRLCSCKREHWTTIEEMRELGLDQEMLIMEPVGCAKCANTGFLGRIGIYEIMPINARLRQLITANKTADELKAAAVEDGMSSLKHSASLYVKEGITAFSEMMKIAYEAD